MACPMRGRPASKRTFFPGRPLDPALAPIRPSTSTSVPRRLKAPARLLLLHFHFIVAVGEPARKIGGVKAGQSRAIQFDAEAGTIGERHRAVLDAQLAAGEDVVVLPGI